MSRSNLCPGCTLLPAERARAEDTSDFLSSVTDNFWFSLTFSKVPLSVENVELVVKPGRPVSGLTRNLLSRLSFIQKRIRLVMSSRS